MAAGRIVLSSNMPARDRNDRLVAGAKLYVYVNNTTTLASIYTTSALLTPLANPVVANSSGAFSDIWAEAGTTASPTLYTLSITGPNGESIGNPSVFDDYSPSLDYASDATAFARTLLDDTTAAEARTTLGASVSFGSVLDSTANSTTLNAAAEGTLLTAGTYTVATDVAGLGKAFYAFGAVKFTGAGTLQSPTRYGVGALANNVGFDTGAPTLTDKNSAFGTRALYNNTTGYHNSAFGDETLRSCTTGMQNSAFGLDSQYYLTTGRDNSSFGVSALRDNVTGVSNTAVGRSALFGILGDDNCGFGRNVAYAATTVSKLAAFGSEAFWNLTTGDENAGFGYRTQYNQTTGAQNATFGVESGYSGSTNSRTSFFGYRAGFYNTVDDTTGFGYRALNANTTGLRNTAAGADALLSNTTGSDNAAFGRYALQANTTGDESTAFGSQALAQAVSLNNSAFGSLALGTVTTGNSNVAVGRQAGYGLVDGNGNTYIGSGISAGSASESNAIRIGSNGVARYTFNGTNHELVGGYATVGALRVGAVQVVGAQGLAVADAVAAVGAPTQAEFNAFVTQFNALCARVRAGTGHGLIAA